MNTEITKIYRLRNKFNGRFWVGGHATASGLYHNLSRIRVIRKNLSDYYNWEIVEYDLVERGSVE